MNISLQNKPPIPHSYAFPRYHVEWEKPSLLIRPSYKPHGINSIQFDSFIFFIEQIVRSIIPQDLLAALSTQKNPALLKEKIQALTGLLPIVAWNEIAQAPSTLSVSFLCPADFTSGVGRYLCDTLSRWLVPGKFLNITAAQSLNFKFIAAPEQSYFIQQILLDVCDEKELMLVRNNIDNLTKEIRLNIIAVKHARQVVAIKKLSLEQKKIIIQENIASILERPSKTFEHNVFDQMHHFLVHLSAEEKITQIKDQFAPFMEQRPKVFDRDIFNEIKHSVLLFHNPFTALRDLRHVGRIISYQYLFRKSLQRAVMNAPQERHLSIKLMKTQLSDPSSKKGKKTVLSVLGGINVLRENELFEERHVVEAIQRCLSGIRKIDNSFIIDRRSHDPVRTFYIEIEKENGTYFSLSELKDLRRLLPLELKEGIENVIHPVFMPRNEEEIMRNIVILSQQLKYIHDIPQVIITFDQQTEEELSFTVILLRLIKPGSISMPELFQQTSTELKIDCHEVKHVGTLRKKYAKEANVFLAKMEKKPFLRKDYTLDLFKARQALSAELHRILDGIRDFNGGILSKQQEVFQELRDSIADTNSHQDFLLENFFYSLSPPLRQTLLPPAILKKLFNMQQEALKADYQKEVYFLKAFADEQFLLLLAASPNGCIKEELISTITSLGIPTPDLSFTHVHAYGINCMGYIYQERDHHQRTIFYDSIYDALHQWQARLKK
ncbi:MAG: hypothetical protein JSR39_04410 [Verrucomicrobia bacterium]|nr:hypothetical protein [Verrucomicrobiota bacterium]